MSIEILYGAKSDIGLKRHHNEDRFCANHDLGLYVVCDGMGGENAGEVASGLAIEAIQSHIADAVQRPNLPLVGPYDATVSPITNRLASAVRVANETIHRESWLSPDHTGMGTTVVAAYLSDDVLSIAHVGDSRLYMVRNHALHALTTDHSWVVEQVLHGLLTEEEAERSPRKNVVTRALGVESSVDVELGEMPLMSGDILLLCTDGMTRNVRSTKILDTLLTEGSVGSKAERLVGLANEAGGDDNTTVLVVTIQHDDCRGLWDRFRTKLFGT
ncbi:MAG TPA: Stp1/IreP family PP2C-type Ser/Thr phosphatase [Nitrospiraceae bacterium]|jgi:protein phosphatase